jgi:peptide/nickel transport system ATP-binding protein
MQMEKKQDMDRGSGGAKTPVLQVQDLKVAFESSRGLVRILEGVTFDLYPGEILALVGETGCGKSVTAKTVLNLIPQAREHLEGSVLFEGKDLLALSSDELLSIRGRRISMIFQNPQASINPVFTLGEQMERLIRLYLPEEIARIRQQKGLSEKKAVRSIAEEKLREVGLAETDRLLKSYSFEISGGMAQRYKIALALLSTPEIMIADESTSALDVTVQAHILKLLSALCRSKGTAILFITHDLGIAAQICDRIAVMYSGRIVEIGETVEMFAGPLHPYTKGLLGAVPQLGTEKKLESIPGMIPDLSNPPSGCRFHPRCTYAADECRHSLPPYRTAGESHAVACHVIDHEGKAGSGEAA